MVAVSRGNSRSRSCISVGSVIDKYEVKGFLDEKSMLELCSHVQITLQKWPGTRCYHQYSLSTTHFYTRQVSGFPAAHQRNVTS